MEKLLQNRRFLLIVFGIVFFNLVMLNEGGLWDQDEGAYAGFGQQMLSTGNWTIPDFPFSDMHRKTPGHFWSIAVSYQMFGVNEFALRLPGVLAFIALLLSIFFLARRFWGQTLALGTTLVLATTLVLPTLTKIAFTDTPLLLWETLAVLALYGCLREPGWRFNLLLWVSVSIGLLIKGPPILILVGGLWVFLAIFHPDRKKLIGTHPWLWGPIAMLPLLLWGWMAWKQDGGKFITFLWEWYVAKRVGGSVLGQSGPPGYHALVLVVSFLPWLTFFPSSIAGLVRGFRRRNPESIFFAGWLLFGWIFYEIMSSKLPTYSLAAQPVLAILIARQALAADDPRYRFVNLDKAMSAIYVLIMFLLSIGILIACYKYLGKEGMNRAIPVALVGWVSSFTAVVGMYMDNQKRLATGAMALSGALFLFMLWLNVMPLVEQSPIKGTKHTFLLAKAKVKPEMPAVLYLSDRRMKKPSVPFYLRKYFKNASIATDQQQTVDAFLHSEPFVLITDVAVKNVLADSLLRLGDNFSVRDSAAWFDMDDQLKKKDFWILVK